MSRLSVLDVRGEVSDLTERFSRPREQYAAAAEAVRGILDEVRQRGDASLRELTVRFDGVELDERTRAVVEAAVLLPLLPSSPEGTAVCPASASSTCAARSRT